MVRIALACPPRPRHLEDATAHALAAVAEAGAAGASVVCFPEDFLPGYPWPGRTRPPFDPAALAEAVASVGRAAAVHRVGVILGTERQVEGRWRLTAMVWGPDGDLLGHQDKVQLDPSEDEIYAPGEGRRAFQVGALRFGVVICHEGFRYPETVRQAVRLGAQVVFHPHYHEAEPDIAAPATWADPASSFHEAAIRCRAAENTCFVATVNCAVPGAPTTSAVVGPGGELVAMQPRGVPGVLVVDLDLEAATGRLAHRLRS